VQTQVVASAVEHNDSLARRLVQTISGDFLDAIHGRAPDMNPKRGSTTFSGGLQAALSTIER
jgi:hypothetical protein